MAIQADDVLMAMRRTAWQRAKGELNSVLETYFGVTASTPDGQFDFVSGAIEEFIKKVEDSW